jgi:hypothetical protein
MINAYDLLGYCNGLIRTRVISGFGGIRFLHVIGLDSHSFKSSLATVSGKAYQETTNDHKIPY